ncbi:hypothetical protein JMJ35_010688 [Cladonia borealis]|uniref:Uncharacterized protein n=1 Tax=Cladonia borealis TaxID=184061 RepID=A0AA39QPZ5_9LECA|nr:hypothetical protein JMJ35_010688 [Cladonia borealis]
MSSSYGSRALASRDFAWAPPPGGKNIFLFILNFIGYSRIILATVSLYYMSLHPRTYSLLYSASCLLDVLEGAAARYFEQTPHGVVFPADTFPRWSIVFQGLFSLDFASHYTHYATSQWAVAPSATMRWVRPGSPTVFSQIWTVPWSAGAIEMARANKVENQVPWTLLCISCGSMLCKQCLNVVQLVEASEWLTEGDLEMRKKASRPRRQAVH